MFNLKYLLFVFWVFVLVSCGKDKLPPEFSSIGNSFYRLPLYGTYNDSGVVVTDKKSKNIYIDTVTNFRSDSLGIYYFKYVAYDDKMNIGTYSRTIKVILVKNNLSGKCDVNETVTSGPNTGTYGPYEITVLPDATIENKIEIYNFGGYGADEKAYCLFDEEGNLTIPEQQYAEGILKGHGKVSYNARSFTINYELVLNEGTDVSTFSANYK